MNVEDNVKMILSELTGVEIISNEVTLLEDLALDSLMMVTLLLKIEDTFNIELLESDMNPYDLTSVQSVIDMVEKYCKNDKASSIC